MPEMSLLDKRILFDKLWHSKKSYQTDSPNSDKAYAYLGLKWDNVTVTLYGYLRTRNGFSQNLDYFLKTLCDVIVSY